MTAYVLVQAWPNADFDELAQTIAQVAGVRKAERVSGPFDVIAELGPIGLPAAASQIGELSGVLRAIPLPLIQAREGQLQRKAG
jgi:hypothetical protein